VGKFLNVGLFWKDSLEGSQGLWWISFLSGTTGENHQACRRVNRQLTIMTLVNLYLFLSNVVLGLLFCGLDLRIVIGLS